MSHRDVIDRIREHNPSAQPTMLAAFDDDTLHEYLERLETLSDQRGSRWERTKRSSVFVAREHSSRPQHAPARAA